MSEFTKTLKNPVVLVELLTWAGAAIMWFATMTGLPDDLKTLNVRVTNAEERIRLLEQNLEKNNTKTDLILSAVYELRNDIKMFHKNDGR